MKRFLFMLTLFSSTIFAKDLVYDKTTSLLWQDSIDNKELSISYDEAKDYCSKLKIGKYKNFRIPTLFELQSLIDYKRFKPAMIRGFNYEEDEIFWSSTPYADDKEDVWGVNFKHGKTTTISKNYDRNIRCVKRKK